MREATDPMLMMRPPDAGKWGITAWVRNMTPRTLRSMTASYSSCVVSGRAAWSAVLALLTSMSIVLPNVPTHASTIFLGDSRSRMSARIAMAAAPWPRPLIFLTS